MTGNKSIILFLLFPTFIWAQNGPTLLLNCVGEPPEILVQNELEKSKVELEESYKDLDKKDRKELIIESNFALADFIGTGMVCYGDPYTAFLQKILANIKAGNPDVVPSGINIYTTRDPIPNAFAWRDGNLFVNIGLFGIMENDAQIAFILCHEIIHYSNEHTKNQYTYSKELEKGEAGKLGDEINEDELLDAQNFYSRKLETEADVEGLDLFVNSGYNVKEGIKALQNLKLSRAPLKPFDLDYKKFAAVNDTQVDTINDFFLSAKEAFDFKVNEIESKPTTHPALDYRVKYIDSLVATKNVDTEKGTIITTEFKQLQKSIPYDVLVNEYLAGNYSFVIYKALANRDSVYTEFYNNYALKSLYAMFQQAYGNTFSMPYPIDESEYSYFYFYLNYAINYNDKSPIIESVLSYFAPESLNDESYFYYCALQDLGDKFIAKEESTPYEQVWYSKYLEMFSNGEFKSVATAKL